jgi:hypothetical protein
MPWNNGETSRHGCGFQELAAIHPICHPSKSHRMGVARAVCGHRCQLAVRENYAGIFMIQSPPTKNTILIAVERNSPLHFSGIAASVGPASDELDIEDASAEEIATLMSVLPNRTRRKPRTGCTIHAGGSYGAAV